MTFWKMLVSFAVGASIGGVVGYQIRKKKEESLEELDIQSYLDEINNLSRELVELKTDKEKSGSGLVGACNPGLLGPRAVADYSNYSAPSNSKGDLKTLQALASKYRDPDLNAHLADRFSPPDDDPEDEIRVVEISEERVEELFSTNNIGVEQLFYYPINGMLIGDGGFIYTHPEEILGEYLANDISIRQEDVIWIWNKDDMLSYEIILRHGEAYEEKPQYIDYTEDNFDQED